MPKNVAVRQRELRSFVQRVNSDPAVRLQFLADPVKALDAAGIKLSDKASSDLAKLVNEYLKSFPNIALLPTGLHSGSKGRVSTTEEECARILIL